jgi:hypothetical protein
VWLVAIQSVKFFHILEIRSVFSEICKFNAHKGVFFEVESIEAALPEELRDVKDRDLGHSGGFVGGATEFTSILSNYLLFDMH